MRPLPGRATAVIGSTVAHGAEHPPQAGHAGHAMSTAVPPAGRATAHDPHAGHAEGAPPTAAMPADTPSDQAGHAVAVPGAAAPARGEMAQMGHAMGHGGGMSMDDMVRDMRNSFIVALILAIPIFLYSPLATEVFKVRLATPLGIDPKLLAFPWQRRPSSGAARCSSWAHIGPCVTGRSICRSSSRSRWAAARSSARCRAMPRPG